MTKIGNYDAIRAGSMTAIILVEMMKLSPLHFNAHPLMTRILNATRTGEILAVRCARACKF